MKLPDAIVTDMTQTIYVDKMCKERKLKWIGGGSYAAVYSRPKWDRVIKIGCATSDKYINFVKVIGMESDCIHFPKIHDIKIFETFDNTPNLPSWYSKSHKYYVIEMERLIPFRNIKTKCSRALYRSSLGIHDYFNLDCPMYMEPATPHGKKVKRVLSKLFEEHHADMHDGNIMWRKRGKAHQLVITDPIC